MRTVSARTRLDNGMLVARSTGPESLVMFGAPGDARGTLRRLILAWSIPANALAGVILGSIGWIVWMIVR